MQQSPTTYFSLKLKVITGNAQGHYFIWQLSPDSSCWLICHINAVHSADYPHVRNDMWCLSNKI